MSAWIVVCALLVASPGAATEKAPATELIWSRSGPGDTVRVEARHPGPALGAAQATLQRTSDHLDALRTVEPHVVWTRMEWRARHVRVEGRAVSSLYAGVAMKLLRSLFPGYRTAGSGVQQLHNVPAGGWSWRLRALLSPPTPTPGSRRAPP